MAERRTTPILSYGESQQQPERYTFIERGQEFIPPLPNGLEKIGDMPEVEIAARIAEARNFAEPSSPESTDRLRETIQEIIDTTYVLASVRDQAVENQALNPEDRYGLAA